MDPKTRLQEMIAERQKRKDLGDLPLSMTRREADAYLAETAELDVRIGQVRNAQSTLARSRAELEPELKWRDDLTTWREQFCKELLTFTQDHRDRAEVERQQGLKHSILCVDRGCGTWPTGAPMLGQPIAEAIRAAGYPDPSNSRPGPAWLGSMPQTEKRIAEHQKRIAQAQRELDDALLTDAERAKQEAESEQYRRTLRGLRCRIGPNGQLVPYRANDSEMPDAELTPAQRAVLALANAATV